MDQLTLSFEPGLVHRYRSVLECLAAGVYRRGLQRVAGELDCAPSNLSTTLSGQGGRKFGVDDLERYLERVDLDPLYYLIERHLQGRAPKSKAALLGRAEELLAEFRRVVSEMDE